MFSHAPHLLLLYANLRDIHGPKRFLANPIPGQKWYAPIACPTESIMISMLDLIVQLLYMTGIAFFDSSIHGKFLLYEQQVPHRSPAQAAVHHTESLQVQAQRA